ncbi:protein HEADING DATE 3B-like isoform X2 [Telopea speciosissima]|uniref:protein HEADING DATE 3B-like isoform X2 n=1 Tax=Telopea speciosissima TaxID=54955 RepID=UPI001CC7EFBF|nr:protein HEADING DATE 3B-like isoform X2 [Telopea speciosissima]
MEGGKDEEKITGPMFPRLYVNDRENGGPRAPPRNKMALYEQLSVPSQRFNSGLTSTLSLPRHNAGSLVPSTSSSKGGGHERSVFSPCYIPSPTPAHFSEKPHCCSSNGVNLDGLMAVFERKSMKNANYRTSNATGHMPSTPEYNLFHRHDHSNSRNSGQKQLADEDDVRVPTFIHPGVAPCPNKDIPSIDRERLAPFCPTNQGHSAITPVNSLLKSAATSSNLLNQPQDACNKHSKRSDTTDMTSRQSVSNHIEENLKGSFTSRECTEMLASHKLSREKVAEPSKYARGSANLEHQSSQPDGFGRVCDTGGWVQQEYRPVLLQNNTVYGDGISVESVGLEKGNVSSVRSEPFSRISPGNSRRSPGQAEFGSEYHEDNSHGSLQVRGMDRNDDVSETSMLDSISRLDISPDDVVGVIGQNRFWKARRAIVDQQRVFAVQVFELHRLIKVSPTKKLPAEYLLTSVQRNVKQKDDSQNQSIECAAENAVAKPTLPSLNNGIKGGHVSQHSSCGLNSGNPPAAPVATDNKMIPWCFHPPPGNQWLVPIISPSEGLFYKPYTGPCPPTGGFMAPVYGGCGPVSLPPMAGDFMNPAYGVMATHQQGIGVLPGTPPVGPTYFTPYGIPVMSPVTSASAVDQSSLLAGTRPHGQAEKLSAWEVKFNMRQESSCNYSNQNSEAVASGAWKFKTSKDSELQGSTTSSPCERAQGAGPGHVAEERDPLPLFPMASAVQVPDQDPQAHCSDQQTRVIKVVPHNPRSATESAERIFRSIQKEKQKYDSVNNSV